MLIVCNTYKFYNCLLALMVVLLCSCASKKYTFDSLKDASKLVFINYHATKLDSGKIQVDFISKEEKEGTLKKQDQSNPQGVSGDLYCHQLDKKSHVLHRTLIKNPFLKSFEYLDGANTLNIKSILLDDVNFSLRLQRHPQAKYISIYALNDLERALNTVKLDQ